jgi:hypothetical protein
MIHLISIPQDPLEKEKPKILYIKERKGEKPRIILLK